MLLNVRSSSLLAAAAPACARALAASVAVAVAVAVVIRTTAAEKNATPAAPLRRGRERQSRVQSARVSRAVRLALRAWQRVGRPRLAIRRPSGGEPAAGHSVARTVPGHPCPRPTQPDSHGLHGAAVCKPRTGGARPWPETRESDPCTEGCPAGTHTLHRDAPDRVLLTQRSICQYQPFKKQPRSRRRPTTQNHSIRPTRGELSAVPPHKSRPR